MNKRAIWAIIGLMSAAVIGLVWLQMDLLRTAIRVNEEQFDENVYNALSDVVSDLTLQEQRRAFSYWGNGFVTSFLEGRGSMESTDQHNLGGAVETGDEAANIDELISRLTGVCTCSKCMEDPNNPYRQLLSFYERDVSDIPIAERINPSALGTLLRQELGNHGINTEFYYGVYSREKRSLVILDDHFVVEDNQPKESLPGHRNIFNSKYRVHLFPNEMPSPGLLMVHFPSRSSFLWSSLRYNFMGSVLFTAIILISFGYTIHVIFRQKKLSEMKTDFINNMTHEFKTPIATISLAADSISSPMVSGDPNKVKRFADIIQEENKRMNTQVEKVLSMARLDRGNFTLKLSEVDVHHVMVQAAKNINLQVEKREGHLEKDLGAANHGVGADHKHLSNVINNLLDNANKYSPDAPQIKLSTRDAKGGMEIVIEDQGIGMSKDTRKHIFDKFYRVHTGDLHDVKGFGLGLSYVKAIMTAHHGSVEVQSEPGKGSSFTLFLPRSQAESNGAGSLKK